MPTYAIERCIDQLSSVEVYSGQMTRASGSSHRVAFQVRSVGDDVVDLDALRAEGERIARVTHPALPRLRDVLQLDGRAVHVTDEIEGRSLQALVAERPVPPGAAFEIGAQIAGALEAVHAGPDRSGPALRVRHEALSVGMIRIDRHGAVKLVGIGLGRGPEGASRVAVSPERVLQQEEGLESDVFALADVLIAAVGQVPLFEGLDDEALRALMVDPNALREHCDLRIEGLRDVLGSDRGVALLRAMTAPRKTERPTMAQVAARCDLISDSIDGMGLREFARARVPAAPPATVEGSFTGRALDSSHSSLWTLTETPAAPTPRPVPARRVTPVTAPLPPAPERPPVLGEVQAVKAPPSIVSASLTDQGPMPWSDAETLALFDETPSLAPPRELQPIVVNPSRIPQLVRQHWDDGVTRRYRLAMMSEQLVEEPVDEDSPTLVVREDGTPGPAPMRDAAPEPSEESEPSVEPDTDEDAIDAPTQQGGVPASSDDEEGERTVLDAPEVAEAGRGGPRRPVSVTLPPPPVVAANHEEAARMSAITGQTPGAPASAQPITPPAFPVPAGLESLIAQDPRSPAPPAPALTSSTGMPSPTVVPLTSSGEDRVLGTDHGALDSIQGSAPASVVVRGTGSRASVLAGVLVGGLLGLVAGVAFLYLYMTTGQL